MNVKAYLQVIMTIDPENRAAAAKVYTDYRQPFLDTIRGAMTKELLIRDEDVQVIHGFDSMEHAKVYLDSEKRRKKAVNEQPGCSCVSIFCSRQGLHSPQGE